MRGGANLVGVRVKALLHNHNKLGLPPRGPTVLHCDKQSAINMINVRIPNSLAFTIVQSPALAIYASSD